MQWILLHQLSRWFWECMWLPPLWWWPPLLQICVILFSKRKFFSIRILWAQQKNNNKVRWSHRQETKRKSVNTFGLPCKQGRSRPSSLQSWYNSLQVHLFFLVLSVIGTECEGQQSEQYLLLTTVDPQAPHFLPKRLCVVIMKTENFEARSTDPITE